MTEPALRSASVTSSPPAPMRWPRTPTRPTTRHTPLYDGDQLDREERAALRRVAGLSTELEDITEVEYRQLRLERVVLAGVWTEGTADDAENSMRELAALAETAGSTVLEGCLQRRQQPDPATYLGKGKAIELRDIVVAEGADTVICDSELAPEPAPRARGRRQGQGHRPHRR